MKGPARIRGFLKRGDQRKNRAMPLARTAIVTGGCVGNEELVSETMYASGRESSFVRKIDSLQ
jgi:hypothetical protein